MSVLERDVNADHAIRYPKEPRLDFSSPRGGGAIQDGLPILGAKFNIHSRPITLDQIPEALKQGPVMVAVDRGGTPHGELIIGVDKDRQGHVIPGAYRAYNPLNEKKQSQPLDAREILRDSKGHLEAFALRPYRIGELHPKNEILSLSGQK